jgi:hypothetical protein
MPTNEKPAAKADAAKPICFVFPRRLSAEEMHKALQEMIAKHKQAALPAGDRDDGSEAVP